MSNLYVRVREAIVNLCGKEVFHIQWSGEYYKIKTLHRENPYVVVIVSDTDGFLRWNT